MHENYSINHWLSEAEVDPENLLFHYTGRDGLRAILESGNLRLNTLDAMNDPRERKEWVPRLVVVPEGEITDEFLTEQDAVLSEPDRLLGRGARMACLTEERRAAGDADPGSLFHRGWGRARMWYQYARDHTGAVLVFDKGALLAALDEARQMADGDVFAVSPVKYQDRAFRLRLTGAYRTVEEIRDALDDLTGSGRDIADLYFTKNSDWASETEFRVVVLLWNPDGTRSFTPLDLSYGSSLRAIVLGERFDGSDWLTPAVEGRGVRSERRRALRLGRRGTSVARLRSPTLTSSLSSARSPLGRTLLPRR